jgi:hypothetical protein
MICTSTGTSTTSSYNRHKLPEFAGIPYAEALTRESFAGAWLICPWRPYPIWYQPNFAFMPYRSAYFHWGRCPLCRGPFASFVHRIRTRWRGAWLSDFAPDLKALRSNFSRMVISRLSPLLFCERPLCAAVVQGTSRVGLDPPRDRAQSRCSSDLCMATRGPWRRFSPP